MKIKIESQTWDYGMYLGGNTIETSLPEGISLDQFRECIKIFNDVADDHCGAQITSVEVIEEGGEK